MNNIGIITAMKEEHDEVIKIMKNKEEISISNITFTKGTIYLKECILVSCGIGKVNSARVTTKLIDFFKVNTILNVGSAGAINNSLNIGDVVISKINVQHDFDLTAFGYEKGHLVEIGRNIYSDRKLLEIAKEVTNSFNFKTKIGVIASGDIFCSEEKMKNKIKSKFNADVVDMECGAIAHICYLEHIPFISIRSVSDSPNGDNAKTFEENLKLASTRASLILEKMCIKL